MTQLISKAKVSLSLLKKLAQIVFIEIFMTDHRTIIRKVAAAVGISIR